MALYDNKHWLLSHIKNSFISSDDTGMCEFVMIGEDIPRNLISNTKLDCYPGTEGSEEEDEMDVLTQSCDIQSDMDFGVIRPRSHTALRLDKMDRERRRASKIKHIKWEGAPCQQGDEVAETFQRRDFRSQRQGPENVVKQSMLVRLLESCPAIIKNPFLEYAKFDGSAQVGVPTRKYGIFMMMLPPTERNFPLCIVIVATAKVEDLIGLVCWKYTLEYGEHTLKESVDNYSLYIAEDDGEVDWDFPCLDPRETVSKFGFSYLALVEHQDGEQPSKHLEETIGEEQVLQIPDQGSKPKVVQQDLEDMQRMKGHMSAMEAHLYKSYRVLVINKVRSNVEVQLGISGEKIEIDPVVQQKVSAKIWSRQKAVSYDIDCVTACDLTDTKSNNRATFRLVYYSQYCANNEQLNVPRVHSTLSSYKHYDFEADVKTAEEIVQKINNILELTSSTIRQEYIVLRENKSQRKRSFHLGSK